MHIRPMIARGLALTALALALITPPSRAATATDTVVVHPLTFRIEPANPCPSDTLYLVADLCAPCGQFISAARVEGVMRFEVFTRAGVICPAQPCPIDSRVIRLGAYPVGTHSLGITTVVQTRYPDSTTRSTRLYSDINWTVRDSCPPPPPPPVGIPYGTQIHIQGPAACDTCAPQLCPTDSLRVRVSGWFPDGCYDFLGLEKLPLGSPLDLPFLVMRVARRAGVCTQAPVPFEASIAFAPQPIGPGVVRLKIIESAVPSGNTDPWYREWELRKQFNVLEFCDQPEACVWPWLDARPDTITWCAARIQPGGTTVLPFQVRTPIALAGLEGFIRPESPLRIEALSLGQGAEGMRLEWQRDVDGSVRWVLFAGAARIRPFSTLPILRVTLRIPTDASNIPQQMAVLGMVTGASDSLGGKVPICQVETFVRVRGTLVCLDGGCDVNGDGIANVRDLVRMARCLRPGTFCPDSASLPDCDGNGVFGVADVICCARHVLHGGVRDSSAARNASGLSAWFGTPRASADGVDLPFSLTGVGDLGSARVVLRYPTDRYEWNAAEFQGDPNGWLALAEEITPGVVALGAIQMGGDSGDLPWTLGLKLRPGATPGGRITVESGEFSATDGVTLTSPVAGISSPSMGEQSGARVALGAARPNPSAGDSRFSVELPNEADVDLSVHDISGRTVATLHRGRLAAGTRDFVWRGTDDSGRRTPDGVYFVRLRVNGLVKSQRVTVLRGR